MAIEKLWSTYKATATFSTHYGDQHEIFYNPDNGDLRLDDGSTPGGLPLTFSELRFNTDYVSTGSEPTGSIHWNSTDQTVDIHHPGGVVQQVGQESYAFVRNKTGNTITNGTAVRFAGAEQNGVARLLVAPFQADGTYPTLYGLGITTQDIANNEDGKVTTWGVVRGIDTSSFSVGNILYVDPDTAGGLTATRPTAPDNVIPMAAVLKSDADDGEIFVRPSYEQQKNYAEFSDTNDQSAASNDTAYSITYNNTGPTQQISLVSNSRITFAEAGFYQFTVNAQVLSTNSSAKDVRFWFSKNGTDISNTTRIQTLTGNNEYRPFSMTHSISVTANDYIEVKWATTSTTARLKAAASTSYAPASPSVQVIITQPAL